MIDKSAVLSLLLVAGCAAAAEPGLFKAGSTTGSDGWKLTYSAVAKPALPAGQHIAIQTDASHTDEPGRPPVFHRFFADPVNKTYFGYDVVIQPAGDSGPAVVRFQKLSLRGDQLPRELGAAQFHAAAIPQFPAETYHAGQTIAVDVLKSPSSTLRVVDYVQVTRDKPSSPAPSNIAKTIGNPSAPVRIDLFSDYECPACKIFHEVVLPALLKDYIIQGRAYLVSYEFPLPMHQHSREAANLALAAARVNKYQQVGDVLFHNQEVWGANGKVWEFVASVLTPEEQKKVLAFSKDQAVLAQVQQEVDLGLSQKVGQTPTIFVSRDAKHYGFPGPTPGNYAILKSLIDQLLK